MRNKQSLYILLTFIWVAIIFLFSLQPAETSERISTGLGQKLMEMCFPNMSEEGWEILHFLIRKAGHFTEFLILGIFSTLTTLQTKIRWKKWIRVLFCVLVATMDETIQLFVDGRSGQVSDVILDSSGALVGIVIMSLTNALWKNVEGGAYADLQL